MRDCFSRAADVIRLPFLSGIAIVPLLERPPQIRRDSEQSMGLCTGLRAQPRVRKLGFQAPLPQIVCIESDAKEITGKEAEFRRSHSDETDNDAVGSSNNPALPQLLADKDRRQDG